jgi:glycerol-3-phosphate dehydrogenase
VDPNGRLDVRPIALDPTYRSAALERMRTMTHDILVIGGGVTGAGIALDAVTRDLTTALVEQRDLSSGTSSRSSKLLHGGLRYLEQYGFGRVREALRERDLHLVLARRTRVSIETFDRGVGAAPTVARLMAGVLGWDDDQVAREVAHYEARVAAERESQRQVDDLSADAARLGAPDVRAASRS